MIVPPGTKEDVEVLKNKLLENARLLASEAPLTTIDFQTAQKYQESRPSLKSLKTHLQYVKCSSVEWEREDPRVTKELLYATWMFADRSQVLVIERKLHPTADRYRLLVPFRAFLGARFNASTDTLAVHVKCIPAVQLQITGAKDSLNAWKTPQDFSLPGSDEQKVLPLTITFHPDKTSLAEIQRQFRQQARLSQALNAGIKPDLKYEENNDEEDFHKDRRPIVLDPTLVRAAQLADINLMTEVKENGHDVTFLVKMYFGLEKTFNKLLRTRVQSLKTSSASESSQ